MPIIIVTTQAQLAALPASFNEYTIIEIRDGTQLCKIVIDKKWENSSVVARENSSVEAWGNSSVVARENSSVEARENSSVVARENSSVVARENSSVEARENSSVEAWGNSSVEAWGNSSVVAWENASVHVQGPDCSLELFGFAVAWLLTKAKKVKLRSKTAHVITPEYKQGLKGWLDREGVDVDAKRVVLFKRVSQDWQTQEGTSNETIWKPGDTLEHPNWSPKDQECGEGKYHACSRPYFCNEFRSKLGDRYVAIQIATADLFAWPNPGYPHKIAFRAGRVLYECNKMGRKLDAVLKP